MTIAQAIHYAQSLGLERLDAQLLVLHVLGRLPSGRAWLLAHGDDALPSSEQAALQALAARRTGGEPMAYITGSKAFYGLTLAVDARVLDPRADTETLVDWMLEVLQAQPNARVIDLGTGSGAIALALKHAQPQWEVHAVDFSADALAVARANAHALQLAVQFAQGCWLQAAQGSFDAIVSNPPYIVDGDPHLPALHHEPLIALTSGPDGLDAIRTIIRDARAHLKPGGWLLLEHGYDQAAQVRALLHEAGFTQIQSRRDLAGIERCCGGQWQAGGNITN
jgi:release factor glutamine methyltransferase